MSDAEIVIGVRGETTGGRQVQRTLDDIANSGDKATRSVDQYGNTLSRTKSRVDSFTSAMRTLAGVLFVRELARLSDGFVGIENKLRVVTSTTQEFNVAMKDVQSIAQNTFASLEGTAATYSRMAIATKNLGITQDELRKIVEATNNTFRLSGATTTEVAAASIQLAQGLASGALQGDELRSVLENNIVLGNLLADAFGTNVGQLRKMAADGVITADVIKNVLLKNFNDLEASAKQLSPTIGQSFSQLYNAIQTFIGQSETLRLISTAVSTSVKSLADNFSTVATVLGIVTAALTTYLVVTNAAVIGTRIMTTAVAAFNAVLLANPIGLFVAAVVTVGTAAYVFRTQIYDFMVKPIAAMIITVDTAITKIQEFYDSVKNGFDSAVSTVLVATGTIDAETAKQVLADRKSTRVRQNKINPEDLAASINDVLNRNTLPPAATQPGTQAPPATNMGSLQTATAGANKELKAANDNSKELEENVRRIAQETDRFANSAADAFGKFISGSMSAKDALRSVVNDLLQLATREFITAPLGNIFKSVLGSATSGSGGGFMGGIFSSIGKSIGGVFGFAEGGSMRLGGTPGIDQNILSLNGQPIARTGRGETLSISPNGGSQGGQVVVNQTINVSTGVVDTVRAEITSLLPKIQESAIAGVKEANLRGYA